MPTTHDQSGNAHAHQPHPKASMFYWQQLPNDAYGGGCMLCCHGNWTLLACINTITIEVVNIVHAIRRAHHQTVTRHFYSNQDVDVMTMVMSGFIKVQVVHLLLQGFSVTPLVQWRFLANNELGSNKFIFVNAFLSQKGV